MTSTPSPMNFSTYAEGVRSAGDAIEPRVQCRHHGFRRNRFGKFGEPAQVGEQQDGADGFPVSRRARPASTRAGAAAAEIGFEQSRRRGAPTERDERCGGEALDRLQQHQFAPARRAGERAPRRAGALTGARLGPRGTAPSCGEPVVAGGAFPGPAAFAGALRVKVQRLDHHAGFPAPQPGAAGNDRMPRHLALARRRRRAPPRRSASRRGWQGKGRRCPRYWPRRAARRG